MPSLLIVSYAFPPDFSVGAKRALRMASYLPQFGWKVKVLTVHESYFDQLDRSLLQSHSFSLVRTHEWAPKHWLRRLRSALSPTGRGIRAGIPGSPKLGATPGRFIAFASRSWDAVMSIPDEHGGWIPLALPAALLRAQASDLVLATIPPNTSALVAAMLSVFLRVPLVIDYRDPWLPVPGEPQWPNWRLRVERGLQKFCLRRAGLILTTTEGLGRELGELGAARIAVVPNGFEPGSMSSVEPTQYGRFTIVYTGHLTGLRSALPLLEALRRLREARALPPGGLAFHIVGRGGDHVAEQAERLGVGDLVEVEGFVPYREALARIKGADVLLLVVGESHAHLVPAKLFDYLAAGRFILALAPPGSEAGAIISDLGVGRVFSPAEVRGIAATLAERFTAPPETPKSAATRYHARETMRELDRHLRTVLMTSRRRAPG